MVAPPQVDASELDLALREERDGPRCAKHTQRVDEQPLRLVDVALVDEQLGEVDAGLGSAEVLADLQGDLSCRGVPLAASVHRPA